MTWFFFPQVTYSCIMIWLSRMFSKYRVKKWNVLQVFPVALQNHLQTALLCYFIFLFTCFCYIKVFWWHGFQQLNNYKTKPLDDHSSFGWMHKFLEIKTVKFPLNQESRYNSPTLFSRLQSFSLIQLSFYLPNLTCSKAFVPTFILVTDDNKCFLKFSSRV